MDGPRGRGQKQGRELVVMPIRRPLLIGEPSGGPESWFASPGKAIRFRRSSWHEASNGCFRHPSSVVEHSLGKGEVVGSNPMGGSWVCRG